MNAKSRIYRRVGLFGALGAGLALLMGADGCEFKCESKGESKDHKSMVTQADGATLALDAPQGDRSTDG